MAFGYLGVSMVCLSQNEFSPSHYVVIQFPLLGDMAYLLLGYLENSSQFRNKERDIFYCNEATVVKRIFVTTVTSYSASLVGRQIKKTCKLIISLNLPRKTKKKIDSFTIPVIVLSLQCGPKALA